MSKIYKIHHHYNKGNQNVFVKCKTNPVDFAVYIEFLAEDYIDTSISIWTEGIAKALVEFFECEIVESNSDAIDVDMYFERASRCGIVKPQQLIDRFSKFDKKKILDFIEPYSDYIKEAPTPGIEWMASLK